MTIGPGVLWRAMFFASAVGFIWLAAAFLTYGIFLLLMPAVGLEGAALLSALICAALSSIILIGLFMRAPVAQLARPVPVETPIVEGGALVKALSELAHDHPLMAVCCAAILGATNGNDPVRRR